ncbi:MAG: alpha-L-fucosidase [Candidatus Aminicenantes bacterium]|nr:alpha-L-fucosidase [Candidatus Aminicenantes bacterium]
MNNKCTEFVIALMFMLVWAAFGAARGLDQGQVEKVIAAGPFAADWKSLENAQVPLWYVDGKFGIFIHWGVYSVPAFGSEWYPRQMYLPGTAEFKHHLATYGPQNKFGYKDFIPLFKAEKFDPQAWAALFKRAGAKFVVPVAEHHDGFPMYDSSLTRWCAGRMGPKRDIVGDLATAVRAAGLVFGVSSHRAEHWWFMNGGRKFDSDVKDPRVADFYGPAALDRTQPDPAYLEDWFARCVELVDKYQPQLFWFDWWIEQPVFQPYLERFAAYYYNQGVRWNKGVAINDKLKTFPDRAAVLDLERGQLADIRPLFWQTDTSISKNSWGYVEKQDYKTAGSIVDDLIDIVSKNGALLLNIGPRADGTIPEKEAEILLEVGEWLATNGEAIYGTQPWKVFGEGPTTVKEGMFTDTERADFTGRDLRFTTKGDRLYVIALAWPERELVVKSLGKDLRLYPGEVGTVSLAGHEGRLEWTRDADALRVSLPANPPAGRHAYVFRVEKK